MRLINTTSLQLESFTNERSLPLYAILSHRWEDEEILFADISSGNASRKNGYRKFAAFCQQAKSDSYRYIWIDTCCIDKSSSAELSEAINSMYRWYKRASVCYAFLYDFDEELLGTEFDTICNSSWFTRSWTLQELIATEELIFFDRNFQMLSTKAASLPELSRSTGIPEPVLSGEQPPSQRRVSEVMQWAACRNATREEDVAYSLLGLFDVNMPMLYGEGSKAFARLQEEILKKKHDHSIFLSRTDGSGEIFAPSPAYFSIPESPEPMPDWVLPEPCSMTNLGVSVVLDVIPWDMNIYVARLEGLIYANREYPFIFLRQVEQNVCERIILEGRHLLKGSFRGYESGRRQLYIGSRQRLGRSMEPVFFGFDVSFRERSEQHDTFISSRQINGITHPPLRTNPCLVRFSQRDHSRVFEIRWSDGQISTVRIRFGLDFKPICLIKNTTFGNSMSNPGNLRVRSTGDDVFKKTFSEANGLENLGWTMSDQAISFPTMDDFWALKGPIEATSLVDSRGDSVGLSVELVSSKPSRDEAENVWSFTLINDE